MSRLHLLFLLLLSLSSQPAPAQNVSPRPEGAAGVGQRESKPAPTLAGHAPDHAPNVIIILLSDIGFGQLGSYGGPIETPHIDELATGGLRYVNFHSTGIGAPTSASLLTGRNHHDVGMAGPPGTTKGVSGTNRSRLKSAATLAEVLKLSGYNTLAVGRWDLLPATDATAAGPFAQWPLGMGFERFYGFLGSETDQWTPALSEDNHRIATPDRPGYDLTADLTDRAIGYLRDQQQATDGQPFFLYLAYGAAHPPLQAPRSWIDRYDGRFDRGWDRVRAETFDRQKRMGIVPKEAQLPSRPSDVKVWTDLGADEKKLFARLQQTFAGHVSYTDHHIGRLLETLGDLGIKDKTLILLLSTNGASAEGGPDGSTNVERLHNALPMTVAEMLKDYEKIGSPDTAPQYPAGWAMAGNTPFRGWKGDAHPGANTVPLIVHWPAKIRDSGKIRSQYHHVVDLMPTVLEAVGISPPDRVNGVDQKPLAGTSFHYTIADARAPTAKTLQYYETFGNRALWFRGWTAVASHRPGSEFRDDHWALYQAENDFAQSADLSATQPAKLRELIDLWWAEAGKHGVLPLEDHEDRGLGERRHAAGDERERYVFYPGTAPLPTLAAPRLTDRSYAVTAFATIPQEGAEGVLVGHGGAFGGWVLFVRDRKLHYVHNCLKMQTSQLVSSSEIPKGNVRLRFEFTRTGQDQGKGTLFINGVQVAKADDIRTAPLGYDLVSGNGVQIGRSWGSAVAGDYAPPFPFTGELHKVTVEVKARQDHSRQRTGR
ncbi:MAG: arylsulfatase [Proteobacteria bacterium]|nr:arylsulfatase [Pseudomonadota bacterium]